MEAVPLKILTTLEVPENELEEPERRPKGNQGRSQTLGFQNHVENEENMRQRLRMNLSQKGLPVLDIPKKVKQVAPWIVIVVISILSKNFKTCRWPPSYAPFDKVRRRSRLEGLLGVSVAVW